MGLQLGGLLGAAANIGTALSKDKSLKTYLKNLDKFGVQVRNNFEVNFSGLEDITFFVTDITVPGMHQNFATVHYDGKEVFVPITTEYEHDFNMTVINDGNGYIYSAIQNFFMSQMSGDLVANGYTMTVKALTGDPNYKGSLYTYSGVQFVSIGSLSYGYSQNAISTFDVSMKCIDCVSTPGGLKKAAGILGGINSIIG